MRWTVPGIALAGALAAWACASTPTGTIALTLGGEPDALTRAPAPTSLAVDLVDADGGVTSLGHVSLPATQANLADLSQDTGGAVRITGTDATGAPIVSGTSLPIDVGGLGGGTLSVFVQRRGEMARMPGALLDARPAPLVAIADGRYVMLAGGGDPANADTTQLYDLLDYTALPSPPKLPRAPKSLVVAGTKVLAVDDTGASIVDLADASSADVTPPAGVSFSDLVGGAAIALPDGSAYLVGATRATSPTGAILHMDASATIAFATLATARAGAAAAYVPGRGLVVFGGSAAGAGIEVLPDGATATVLTSFPPQARAGASLTALDRDHLVAGWVNGATGSFAALDLTSATPAVAPVDAPIPCAATHLDLVAVDARTSLGVAEAGASCAFTWNGATVTPVPLKVPRAGARAIALPTGGFAVVGGATTLESFRAK